MVHFLPASIEKAELSTSPGADGIDPVDDWTQTQCAGQPVRLGLVVPKRHARRSVTRNTVKRQLREATARKLQDLPAGDWVVRLRAPLDRKLFVSATSGALVEMLRAEIEVVFQDAARRALRASRSEPRPAPAPASQGSA